MKRIIKISLLLVFAVAQMGCVGLLEPLPPYWGGGKSYPDDYEGVLFVLNSDNEDAHYKMILWGEQGDYIMLQKYQSDYSSTVAIDTVNITKNNTLELFETPWHCAMETLLGGVTRCEIYKMDDDLPRNAPISEGFEGKEPFVVYEVGDSLPNSFFDVKNWKYRKGSMRFDYAPTLVTSHEYIYKIIEPAE